MLNLHKAPPKQVLLRLPDDVAAQLARAVPQRQRNKYLVELLRRDLAQEDQQLIAACEALNAYEAAHPELLAETQEWLDADLTGSVDDWDPDFDREAFERDLAKAQAARCKSRIAK